MSYSLLTWSLQVQLGAAVIITLFFAVLAYSVRLEEVRLWSLAWFMGALAAAASCIVLSGTVAPQRGVAAWVEPLLLAVICAAKTLFALGFILGTRSHFQPGALERARHPLLVGAAIAWGLALGFLAPSPMAALPPQWLLNGCLFLLGGWWALRGMEGRSRWLGWVLFGEGLLFLSYLPQLALVLWSGQPLARMFQISSLLDSGADLLLALATLVALESSQSRHLQQLNDDLYAAFERLGQLVDNDPLTGLINRRGLRRALEAARERGAAVIFLDIDGFKLINDRHGHDVGDACLVRVAELLSRHFRPEDSLIRWGGDEMLVVAPQLSSSAARERIAQLRAALAASPPEVPRFTLSIGLSRLDPGGEPTRALKEADEAMYAEKRRGAAGNWG